MSRRKKIAQRRRLKTLTMPAPVAPSTHNDILVTAMADEMCAEIDEEIIGDNVLPEPSVIDRIGALGDSKLDARIRAWDRITERRRKRIEAMTRASDVIHKRTVAQPANWVIASPAIGKMLDPTGAFSREIGLDDLKDLP